MRKRKDLFLAGLFFLSALSVFSEDRIVKLDGKQIVLHDDFTWEYLSRTPAEQGEALKIDLQITGTTEYTSGNGRYTLNLTDQVWSPTTGLNQEADFQFVNRDKNGFCVVLYDGFSIPLDSMKEVLIINAANVDPNARIVEVRRCLVNGVPGELVTYTAKYASLNFTFLTFITNGEDCTVQYTFYTLSNMFERLEPDFITAISGFRFSPAEAP